MLVYTVCIILQYNRIILLQQSLIQKICVTKVSVEKSRRVCNELAMIYKMILSHHKSNPISIRDSIPSNKVPCVFIMRHSQMCSIFPSENNTSDLIPTATMSIFLMHLAKSIRNIRETILTSFVGNTIVTTLTKKVKSNT